MNDLREEMKGIKTSCGEYFEKTERNMHHMNIYKIEEHVKRIQRTK